MTSACPRCQYDLTGLPEIHTCPECGFQYDFKARTIVFSEPKRKEIFWFIMLVAFTTVIFFDLLRRGIRPGDWPMALMYVANAIGAAFALLRPLPPRRFMSIDSAGLQFDPPIKGIMAIPWQEFGEAKPSWADGSLLIFGKDGHKIVRCAIGNAINIKQVRALVIELNGIARGCRDEGGNGAT
ncbi:MAG: hypothetical protein HY287_15960 [Planctomycetes bacterium]|nr:hypothetical protein [Planctomycetota bacterium]